MKFKKAREDVKKAQELGFKVDKKFLDLLNNYPEDEGIRIKL
jgi:hypothetical protein